ncbi:MAG: HAD family hydrolase [Alphaproteobacteria bacterium]|jgi:HAD superfamily hydrolase (TIGR01509 family)|nr:HAD family hydrolase [Alphaproteobacteria bacterium]MBT4018304.1 HAD family hydrolase [Alphaproteobacteria bacterium]MBT4964919.1 HAD family hydrolase [Alphaproteobacteria bacterium]MBT5159553.1 HAD family hydrolase [Alphaproteobacteria bacterium]MBT5920435.1 HAD family hydrolase [Alphaproteobacteria bacterium]
MLPGMKTEPVIVLEQVPELVIFDCDGVLVDSEGLANRVLCETLNGMGLNLSPLEVAKVTTGMFMTDVVAWAEGQLGRSLPDDFVADLREADRIAFEKELQPVPGIVTALDEIATANIPVCVGSSGPLEKMDTTLAITGLLPRFEGRYFSAHQVGKGKPAPDVFLFAAENMAVSPDKCVVVEDSVPGVQAAVAAGMDVFAYAAPGSEALGHGPETLAAAGGRVFRDMLDLPGLLGLSRQLKSA